MNPIFKTELFVFTFVLSLSILTLQLGLNYWISGASLGVLSIVVLAILSGLHVVWLKQPLFISSLLWLSGVLFSSRILYIDDRPLYQARLIFFILLYVFAFVGTIFPPSSSRWSLLVLPVINSSVIANIFLFIFYIFTLLPGSPFGPEKLIFFLDKFLVANKTFGSLDVALNSLRFSDLYVYNRISLLFGEPSYLSCVVGVTTFNSLLALRLVQLPNLRLRLSAVPRRLPIILSIISGFLLIILSGSIFGFIFLSFLSFLVVLTIRHQGIFRFVIYLVACALILFALQSLLPSGLTEYIALRFEDIFSGQDRSASGRVYPLLVLISQIIDNPLGFGGATGQVLLTAGFLSADVGIAIFTLVYGLVFFFFLLLSFLSISYAYRGSASAFAYCIFIVFIWSQSGNILSTDKFFMTVLPIPLLAVELAVRESFLSRSSSLPYRFSVPRHP